MIARIAGDGMADVLHVDADLVASAGVEFEGDEAVTAVGFQYFIMCDGASALAGRAYKHVEGFRVFVHPSVDAALRASRTTFHHGNVAAAFHDVVPVGM